MKDAHQDSAVVLTRIFQQFIKNSATARCRVFARRCEGGHHGARERPYYPAGRQRLYSPPSPQSANYLSRFIRWFFLVLLKSFFLL